MRVSSASAEMVSDLAPADLAELINQLTLAEAATVVSMLPVQRAIEICDQPTMRRRAAILEQLEPARVAEILAGLSADERTDIIQKMGLHERHRVVPKLSAEMRTELEGLLQYPGAHGRRHHDDRVCAARSKDERRRCAQTHPLSRARERIDLCLLCHGARHRTICSAPFRCATW